MLTLKSETKKLFIDAGLEELTVGRDSSGYIALIGIACGEPVLSLGSISVGSKLTKAEKDIVVHEYLEPALTKYATDIRAYIDLRKANKLDATAYDLAKEALQKKENVTLNISQNYLQKEQRYEMQIYGITVRDIPGFPSNTSISIGPDEYTGELVINFNSPLAASKLPAAIKFVVKKYDKSKAILDLYKTITANNILIADAKQKLTQACSF